MIAALQPAIPTPNASILLWSFAIGIVAMVASNWLTSFMLVRDKATLGRAILLPIVGILAWFGFGIVALIIGYALLAAQVTGAVMISAIIVGAIAALVLAVSLPMNIYQIGALRAIAFLIVSGLLGSVFTTSAQYFVVGPEAMGALRSNPVERLAELREQWKPQPPKPTITHETLRQRQAALLERYKQLEIRRKFLPTSDPQAVADFTREKDAYEKDVSQLKSDAAQLEASKPDAVPL